MTSRICEYWFEIHMIMKLIRNPFLYLLMFFITNDCFSQQHSDLSKILLPTKLDEKEYLSPKVPVEIKKKNKTLDLEENLYRLGLPFTTEFMSLLRSYNTLLEGYQFIESFTSYALVSNDNLNVKGHFGIPKSLKDLRTYGMTLEIRIKVF
jgi:hypothetical protein